MGLQKPVNPFFFFLGGGAPAVSLSIQYWFIDELSLELEIGLPGPNIL